jgi:hypothetical protein
MPRGPKGERRPADVIGAAVMVGRIATGEIEDARGKAPNRAEGGKMGGRARARTIATHSLCASIGTIGFAHIRLIGSRQQWPQGLRQPLWKCPILLL